MEVDKVIDYLKNSNAHLASTLVDGFINETTVKLFPLYFLEYIANNTKSQKIIMELSDNNLRILSKIVAYAHNREEDWIPLCASFLHFVSNRRYTELVNNLDASYLDDDLIENLLFAINNSANYFNIKNIDDLRNIDYIREDININRVNTNNPNFLLLNKYGISYDKAFHIYKRYGKDVLELPDSKEKDFLMDIKNIIEGKGTERVVCEDKTFIVNIDSRLRNYFSQLYNEKLYVISENRRMDDIDNVAIYDAGTDFTMCIYSYGMATEYGIPKNYKDDWHRANITTDYLCNSIVDSSSMKTRVKHCVYGFNHFNGNDLVLLAANDLGTGGIYNEVNVTNPFYENNLIADVEFRTPKELINNTRFTNNEVYRVRRRVVDGKLKRIDPDYVVYFKKNDGFRSDSVWEESVNAAKDFNVPIVMVDCEKCLLANIAKVENGIRYFESRYDDSLILNMVIELIYTINYGFRGIAPELLDKYFNRDVQLGYLTRILRHIDEMALVVPNSALQSIDVCLGTFDSEYEKILKSPHWVEHAREQGYEVDKPKEIIALFENKRKEIENGTGVSPRLLSP